MIQDINIMIKLISHLGKDHVVSNLLLYVIKDYNWQSENFSHTEYWHNVLEICYDLSLTYWQMIFQALRFKKAHVTHPELKATFCLPLIGVKKNPSSTMYTSLGVITKGTIIEVSMIPWIQRVTAKGTVID